VKFAVSAETELLHAVGTPVIREAPYQMRKHQMADVIGCRRRRILAEHSEGIGESLLERASDLIRE